MKVYTNKDKGRTGLALAIGYYGSNGYTICLPLNDTQEYDFIIDDGSALKKVQVKCTGNVNKYGVYHCSVKNSGGTDGKIYSYVKDTNIDILFVVCTNGWMFEIPKERLTQKTRISLRDFTSPYSHSGDYSDCLVHMDIIKPKSTYTIVQAPPKLKKKRQVKITSTCIDCGKPVCKDSKRCIDCYHKHILKKQEKNYSSEVLFGRTPTKEDLTRMLKDGIPFVAIGRKYGISDNAIRKWCRKYNLPATRVEVALWLIKITQDSTIDVI